MNTKIELPEGVPPLGTYYFYMTGACNLACRHCWITPSFIPGGKNAEDKSLPFDLFELAIREGLPLGLNHVKFTGGEPFVHPDAERMLEYAANLKLGVTIETNGTLISVERARFLREKSTVNAISVSLDGAGATTHDYMRGVPGSFAQAQAGLKNLVEAGFRPQVIMSLYEGNLDEIEPLANWVASAGGSSLKLNIVQESGRGEHFKERLQGIQQLIELGRWIEKELQKRVTIPLYYSWPPAFQSLRHLNYRGGRDSCSIFNILGILHTGHLSLCGIGVQDENLVYGRLGEDAVAHIWTTHPMILKMRETLPLELHGICGNCLLRDTCLGFCIADNYHRTQDLLAPYWFCDLAEQAGLFPESRKRQPLQQTVSV